MKLAIKLINEEIERKTIFLKADNDINYICSLQKDIDELTDAVKELTIPVVISSSRELSQEFKDYTEKLLLSEKDTTHFLIRAGIIDKNGDLTEHYRLK